MNKTRVLVIEDDADLRVELVDYLQFSGFDVHGVGTVADMMARLATDPWQVLVLDLGLPDGDGLSAARQVRQTQGLTMGIVILTARGQVDDRIAGLQSGADAYLVKPADVRELRATIEQLVKRLDKPLPGWHLDANLSRLIAPDGQAVALTGAEFLLLEQLMEVPGRQLGREQLNLVLPPGGDPNGTRRLDSLLSRLRSKVEQETGLALPLRTFRNQGYMFV